MSDKNYWARVGSHISRRDLLRHGAIVGGAAVGLALVGCGEDDPTPTTPGATPAPGGQTPAPSAPSDPDGPQYGGTIRIGANTMSSAASPRVTSGATYVNDLHTIGDGLTWMGSDGTLVPELALLESFEFEDEMTIVANVRPGVTFQDGEAFTAESVRQHFEIIQDTERTPQFGFRVHVASLDSADVLDDMTVRLSLSQPDSTFLPAIGASAGIPFSVAQVERLGEAELNQPILTGPYQVESADPDDRYRWVRNDNYWGRDGGGVYENGGPPYADAMERVFIGEDESRAAALETGQIDVSVFQGDTADRLKRTDLQSRTYRGVTLAYYINVAQPPFDDIRVRQAHAHALDRDLIVETAYAGQALPNPAWVPNDTYGWSDYEPYPYDPQAARQLLEATGRDLPIDITFPYPQGGNQRLTEQISAIYQQFWNAVGFNVTLLPLANSAEAQVQTLDEMRHAMAWVYGTGMATRPDAGLQIRNFLASDTRFNPSRESGLPEVEQLDDLIDQIMRTFDADERLEYILETQRIARDTVYAQMPVVNGENAVFARNEIGGFDHPQFTNPIAGPAIRPRFLWRRDI